MGVRPVNTLLLTHRDLPRQTTIDDVWAQHAAPQLAQMFNPMVGMVGDPLSDTSSDTSVSTGRFSEGR